MSDRVIYDHPFYVQKDYNDPYVITLLVWMAGSIICNLLVIIQTLNGWLINQRITRHVLIGSSVAVIWIGMFIVQYFVLQRAITIIITFTGRPLTLLVVLQHIELLTMFVSISDFWTERKCAAFQLIVLVLHLLNIPGYIIPFGLEKVEVLQQVGNVK